MRAPLSSIGNANTHKEVPENPERISAGARARARFRYRLRDPPIDIADVDVGRNIGAELQTDQAEADKRIAQAKAEERRAMAVAEEQEMRARVVGAEAEVLRTADAFRNGNLGVMDYYRMQNVQADTSMRESLAQEPDQQGNQGR
ncbi:MAG: flotillin-like FloA family protein [Thermomicrobiales bacterium]